MNKNNKFGGPNKKEDFYEIVYMKYKWVLCDALGTRVFPIKRRSNNWK